MKVLVVRPRTAMSGSLSIVAAALCACTNLSGLNGHSDYACKAPEGVTCQSVSGTYANAVADNLPPKRSGAVQMQPIAAAVAAKAPIAPLAPPSPSSAPPPSATPLTLGGASALPPRSAPLILRLWFKPWEDVDGDLFDQGHVYVQVDGGRWLVEHARRAIREARAPVRAAAVRAASGPPPSSDPPARGPASLAPLPLHPALPILPGRPAPAGPVSPPSDEDEE